MHSCARLLANKTPVAILYVLADHARDDGYAWPGQARIANFMNMSIRQVRRTINKLEEMGDLIVKKNKGESNEYVVTPGLSSDEIRETLITYNITSSPDLVIKQMEKRRKVSFFDLKHRTSEREHRTSKKQNSGHSSFKNSELRTSGAPTPDIAASPDPKEPLGSLDPSEREPSEGQISLSRQNNQNGSTKKQKTPTLSAQTPTTTTPALSAKKPKREAGATSNVKPNRAAKRPPPNSAPPPPAAFQAEIEALYKACDRRRTRRNKFKFIGVAKTLHADGFTADQILLTRRWWDQVGMGSQGKTAPHPSQIEEFIGEAIAWDKQAHVFQIQKRLGVNMRWQPNSQCRAKKMRPQRGKCTPRKKKSMSMASSKRAEALSVPMHFKPQPLKAPKRG